MKKRIEFTVEAPTECTEDQFREWIYFELGGGQIAVSNPLYHFELQVNDDEVIIDPAW